MIRACEKNDINQIVDLELNTLGTTLGYDSLLGYLDNSLIYCLVYENENEILGYISFSFDGEMLEIFNFCVKENYQRSGIGTKIMNYAFNMFTSKGLKSSILEVRESNKKAISFYEKLGYIQISIRKKYYSNNENALILQKIF